MNVDIYVREKNGSRSIRFPILPERIQYKGGETEFVTYEIMDRGPVAIPSGVGLAGIGWESDFPGEGRQNDSRLRGSWQAPKTYHDILTDWQAKGTALNIMVTGYPFNVDVFLKTYEAEAYGGVGDMAYQIEFQEARDITIKTTQVKTSTSTTSKTSSQKRPAEKSTTYTIKKGDSLWKIAAMSKHYGDGSKWKKIYNANKDIIEKTAKKYGKSSSNNGWWIYPGVTLTIPK